MKMAWGSAVLSVMFVSAVMAQPPQDPAPPRYDEALAKRLGADDLGMRNYVMCFLKTGPLKVDDRVVVHPDPAPKVPFNAQTPTRK